jgi:DeoR family transcriptional regulator, aga operon transcriptional repressor
MREDGHHSNGAAARREEMLALIRVSAFAKVGELSERFGISAVTVRADLDALASRGEVHRVRGGAISRTLHEQVLDEVDEEIAIARDAAGLVRDGDTLLTDMNPVTIAFARALAARTELRDVTVFTNGLKTALELEAASPRITVVLIGGTLRSPRYSLVEPMASVMLARINVHLVVIGCHGVDGAAGVTDADLPEAEIKKRMLGAGGQRVVLAGGAKLGRVELARLCPVEQVDLLITGASADASVVESLRDRGCDVRVAL